MGSRFDSIQNRMVGKVHNLYAYPAVWVPSDGESPALTATVLFKDPTREIGFVDWTGFKETHILAEYNFGEFTNLREMANQAGSEEKLVIDEQDGVREYFVRQVVKKYDGRTLIAILESNDDPVSQGFDYFLNLTMTTPT